MSQKPAKPKKRNYKAELDKARWNLRDCKGIPPYVKLIAQFYLDSVNFRTMVAYPKQSTIAVNCGCGIATVERATRALLRVGAFIVLADSDKQARSEGLITTSKMNHRYHNYLRPNLEWAGFTTKTLPDDQIRTIKDIMRARALKPIADDGLKPIADDGLKPIADDGLKPIADGGLKPIADDGTRTVLRTQERTGPRPQGGAKAPQRAASASELPWRAFTHAREQDFVLKDEPPCPDRLASIEDALMDFVEDE